MKTALDKINDYKRDEIAELKSCISFAELHQKAIASPQPRPFVQKLSEKADAGKNGLICEVKRKSPSAGDILAGADPIDIALEYERGGASCLSILTDFPSFGGTLADLEAVKSAVTLPLLRKDFMLDPIQIVESRAHGADCILLIMSSLDNTQAAELQATAREYDLAILTEVHDENELDRALTMGASLIGVNNRNLKEMTTDLCVSERIAASYPEITMVSESGIRTAGDINRLRKSGFRRFLIGESLMKETNRENAVQTLVNSTDD